MMFDSTCNVALTAQEEQLTHIQQQKIEDQFIDKKENSTYTTQIQNNKQQYVSVRDERFDSGNNPRASPFGA